MHHVGNTLLLYNNCESRYVFLRVTMKSYMMEMRETLRQSVNPVQIGIYKKMTVVSEMQEAMKELLEKR